MKPLSVPSQLTFKQRIPVHHPRSFSPPLPRAGKSPKPPEGSLASAQKELHPTPGGGVQPPYAVSAPTTRWRQSTTFWAGEGFKEPAAQTQRGVEGAALPVLSKSNALSPTTTHAHTQKSRLPFCRPLLRVTGISNPMSSLLQQMAKWPWAAASPPPTPREETAGKLRFSAPRAGGPKCFSGPD